MSKDKTTEIDQTKSSFLNQASPLPKKLGSKQNQASEATPLCKKL